jgi:hypothetical protein
LGPTKGGEPNLLHAYPSRTPTNEVLARQVVG